MIRTASDLAPGDRFWNGGDLCQVTHPTQQWLFGMVTVHVQGDLMIRLPAEQSVALVGDE
jgi:hypothetical protein